MIPELNTERFILRAPCADDFAVYKRFFADEQSAFYGGPLREDQAWKQLSADLGHWYLKGYGMWSIVNKSDNKMLGGCGLWWPTGWPRPELSWWLTYEARGAGAAFETSKAVIAYAYKELGWQQVETYIKDDNDAARGLIRKLGGKVISREEFPDGAIRDVFKFPNET